MKKYYLKWRIYFNTTDKIVISITIVCLIWMFVYKLFLIPNVISDLLIDKKDVIADVFYSVVSSSFAAGLFYIVTVFIPKLIECLACRKTLLLIVSSWNSTLALFLFELIGYNADENAIRSYRLSIRRNPSRAYKVFYDYYLSTPSLHRYNLTKSTCRSTLDYIKIYAHTLPVDIANDIIFLNIGFDSKEENRRCDVEMEFDIFVKTFLLATELKKYYSIDD